MSTFEGFDADLIAFLGEIAENNDKTWFDANRKRFQNSVQAPCLALVRAIAPGLEAISPHVVADDRKSGGSMMRIFRDTRFSKDKRPYNTHVSFRFRVAGEKGAPRPGFYLRITADTLTVGTGCWDIDPPGLASMRDAIVERTDEWLAARDDAAFRAIFAELGGESLKRAPRGYPADHPCVEDLKRKNFAAFGDLPHALVTDPDLPDALLRSYAASRPFMAFVCDALKIPF